MDDDLNKYDLEHACTAHGQMTKAEWEAIYREAWSLYYSPQHLETLLRRAATTSIRLSSLVMLLLRFSTTIHVEKLHPLQDGIVRLKNPSERRPGLPATNPWVFWPQFVWETIRKQAAAIAALVKLKLLARAIERDPNARAYMDQALTPVHDDDDETLDLMTKTTGARAAVAHIKRVDQLTHASDAAA
jgi:hypothetical protein